MTSLIGWGSSIAMSRRKDPDQVYRDVLATFDDAAKVRVQAFVISYGLDTKDPLFLFGLASAHLVALVEQAPENWRALFNEFKQELDEWTTQNIRTLEAINQQSQSVDNLTTSFQELSSLTASSSEETQELQLALIQLISVLKKHETELSNVHKKNSSSNQALATRFNQTEAAISRGTEQRDRIWSVSCGLFGMLFVVALLGGWQIRHQNKRIGWLLEKATRQECLLEVVPRETRDCQQYF